MRSEVESELNAFFQKKFGKVLEEGVPVVDLYTIVAKPVNVDMDSPDIQRLTMRITSIQMRSSVARQINLCDFYTPIVELCDYCKEDDFVKQLEGLYARGTIGLSIPDLERKIARGGLAPRINGKIISYDKIHASFKQVQQKLDFIYFKVCIHNNIKPAPFNLNDMINGVNQMEQM